MGRLFAVIDRRQLLIAGALMAPGLVVAVYEAVPVVQHWLTWIH